MTRQKPASSSDAHLIPFLSLASILIPMLLIQAQFTPLAAVDSALPSLCAQPCAGPTRADLGLYVELDARGLRVQGQDPGLATPVELPCPSGVCAAPGDYDVPGLQALLGELKARHPQERSFVLAVDDTVSYEAVIGIFDASRGTAQAPLFPDPVLAALPSR